MTLRVVTQVQDGLGTIAKSIVADTDKDWKHLQEVFQRATNLWPDAPPQVKALADIVTNGKVLQNYEDQDTSPDRKRSAEL